MYEENVSRGIEVLDRERPGWRAFVDVDRLDLNRPSQCVIGQVFDVWTQLELRGFSPETTPYLPMSLWIDALLELGAPSFSRKVKDWHASPTRRWAIDHGFDVWYELNVDGTAPTTTDVDYQALTEAWCATFVDAHA